MITNDNHHRGQISSKDGRMNQTLSTSWKPTKAQLLAAPNKLVPDLIAKNLIVLFAGINPGLYTAAIGRHFGRPGNRFWPALHAGGFTPRGPVALARHAALTGLLAPRRVGDRVIVVTDLVRLRPPGLDGLLGVRRDQAVALAADKVSSTRLDQGLTHGEPVLGLRILH